VSSNTCFLLISHLIALQIRRRHGDIAVCTTALGLHRLPAYGSHKVTAASEFKQRLFSSIYGSDKSHASLNAAPPALSARFCSLNLPLDIGEEELFLPQEHLAAVIAKLDPSGWNTSGAFHRVSSRRAFHLLTAVREEVLELSLGVDVMVSGPRIEYVVVPGPTVEDSRLTLIGICTGTASRFITVCHRSFTIMRTTTHPKIAKAKTSLGKLIYS
jgi:hypothetical protein